jgi:ketosteroid isomerase-like protein
MLKTCSLHVIRVPGKVRKMSATSAPAPATETEAERRKAAAEWVRAFAAGWGDPGGPEAFADHFEPMLDPEVRLIQPGMPELVGLDAFRRGFVAPLFDLVPDIHGAVRGWAADGDRIWIELELNGTLGGRPVRIETVDRITLRDGRAIERRAFLDPLPLFAAVLTRPRAWPRFARVQATQVRELMRRTR